MVALSTTTAKGYLEGPVALLSPRYDTDGMQESLNDDPECIEHECES